MYTLDFNSLLWWFTSKKALSSWSKQPEEAAEIQATFAFTVKGYSWLQEKNFLTQVFFLFL